MKKRIISIFLSLILLFTNTPFSVTAYAEGKEGISPAETQEHVLREVPEELREHTAAAETSNLAAESKYSEE